MAKLARSHRIAARRADTTRAGLGKLLTAGLDLIFPPACANCHAGLESAAGGLLCTACRELFVDSRPACPRCAARRPQTEGAAPCPQCRHERFVFFPVVRLGQYEGGLRSAVLRIKRERNPGLAMAMADLLAATQGGELSDWRPDAVVAIPMHWSRRAWRGVHSAETIANRLAARLDIPIASHVLVRRRRTAPQARLAPSRRKANVRAAFRACAGRDLEQSRLLLVDDIMTTGATLNEAARTLLRSGASEIAAAVVARAEGIS